MPELVICEMDPTDYEDLVAAIVTNIQAHLDPTSTGEVKKGLPNKIPGSSGYEHQIDVSVRGPHEKLMDLLDFRVAALSLRSAG